MMVHYSFLFLAGAAGFVAGALVVNAIWRSDYEQLLVNYQTLLKRARQGW